MQDDFCGQVFQVLHEVRCAGRRLVGGDGRLAQAERSPAFREFINAAGLGMKSVEKRSEITGAGGKDCESHG
jgi:hypothetical protein